MHPMIRSLACAVIGVASLCPADAGAAPPSLTRFAEVKESASLVAGDRRAAIVIGKRWWLFSKDGLALDAALGREHTRLDAILPHKPYWGTRLVLASNNQMVRAGENASKPIAGEIEAIVTHGELELWKYFDPAVAALARWGGPPTPLPPFEGVRSGRWADHVPDSCSRLVPWRVAWAPLGVAVLFAPCEAGRPHRLVTITPSGVPRDRVLSSLQPAIEPEQFATTLDGTPIVVGRSDEWFAIARARSDGSWAIAESRDKIVAIWQIAIDARGGLWTITLGRDASGKDDYRLYRELERVELGTVDGHELVPRAVVFDRDAGIVVDAGVRHPTIDWVDRSWLFAEHPPKNAPLTLP